MYTSVWMWPCAGGDYSLYLCRCLYTYKHASEQVLSPLNIEQLPTQTHSNTHRHEFPPLARVHKHALNMPRHDR